MTAMQKLLASGTTCSLRPDPHGHGSLRPSFSKSSLVPPTIRSPRFTWLSDGKPFRRLLLTSKAIGFEVFFLDSHDAPPGNASGIRGCGIVAATPRKCIWPMGIGEGSPDRLFLLWKPWNVVSRDSIDEALRHASLQVRQDDNCDIVFWIHRKSSFSAPEGHVAGVFGSGKYRPAESPRTVLSVVEDARRPQACQAGLLLQQAMLLKGDYPMRKILSIGCEPSGSQKLRRKPDVLLGQVRRVFHLSVFAVTNVRIGPGTMRHNFTVISVNGAWHAD